MRDPQTGRTPNLSRLGGVGAESGSEGHTEPPEGNTAQTNPDEARACQCERCTNYRAALYSLRSL